MTRSKMQDEKPAHCTTEKTDSQTKNMKSLPSFSNKPWLKYLAITAASFAALQHAQAQVFFINAGNSPGGSYNVFEAPLAGGPVPTKDFISLPGFGMSLATYGNDLFVGEGSPNNVLEYNIQSGQEIGSFAASDPVGLAVLNNTLYVENRGTGISAATANGTIVGYSLTNPSVSATVASGLFEPQALAAHNGDLYVGLDNGGGSGTSGTIEALTPLGTAAPGFTTISGLSEPEGISFSNGNLLVTDNGGPVCGRVQRVNRRVGKSSVHQKSESRQPLRHFGSSQRKHRLRGGRQLWSHRRIHKHRDVGNDQLSDGTSRP